MVSPSNRLEALIWLKNKTFEIIELTKIWGVYFSRLFLEGSKFI